MSKTSTIKNANSKGAIIDYYGVDSNQKSKYKNALGRYPEFNPATALKVIRADPVVKGAIITIVDKVLESGWRIQGRDLKSRKRELENKLKDVRFNKVLRKALFNLLLYNNAYIEIVKKGGQLSDLNVLETTLIKIIAEDNGDIVEYYQDVGRGTRDSPLGTNPSWKPELIVHLKLDEISSNVFSDDNIRVLWDTILIKDAVRDWLRWFFQSNQMRGIFAIKSAGTQKVKDFLSYLKQWEKDKTKPLILEGEVIYTLLNKFSDQGKSIQDLLDWCNNEIIALLQVPPIAIGKPDASGRSNSVEQNQAMNTRVRALHNLLEDDITYDLFPKIDFPKNDFVFGVIDELSMTKLFDTVQVMKNSMFSDDAIKEYMATQGLVFEAEKLFRDPLELAQLSNKEVGTGNEGALGNKSADSAPSRQRQGNQTISKANQGRMIKNSFKGYPYEYETKNE